MEPRESSGLSDTEKQSCRLTGGGDCCPGGEEAVGRKGLVGLVAGSRLPE